MHYKEFVSWGQLKADQGGDQGEPHYREEEFFSSIERLQDWYSNCKIIFVHSSDNSDELRERK